VVDLLVWILSKLFEGPFKVSRNKTGFFLGIICVGFCVLFNVRKRYAIFVHQADQVIR
jgi:hypothetical protein